MCRSLILYASTNKRFTFEAEVLYVPEHDLTDARDRIFERASPIWLRTVRQRYGSVLSKNQALDCVKVLGTPPLLFLHSLTPSIVCRPGDVDMRRCRERGHRPRHGQRRETAWLLRFQARHFLTTFEKFGTPFQVVKLKPGGNEKNEGLRRIE